MAKGSNRISYKPSSQASEEVALAPSASAVGLSNQRRPPIANFSRSELCTRHSTILSKIDTLSK